MTEMESVLNAVEGTLADLQARGEIPCDVQIDFDKIERPLEARGGLFRIRLQMAKGLQVLEIDEALADDYIESVEHPAGKDRRYRDTIREEWERIIKGFCR